MSDAITEAHQWLKQRENQSTVEFREAVQIIKRISEHAVDRISHFAKMMCCGKHSTQVQEHLDHPKCYLCMLQELVATRELIKIQDLILAPESRDQGFVLMGQLLALLIHRLAMSDPGGPRKAPMKVIATALVQTLNKVMDRETSEMEIITSLMALQRCLNALQQEVESCIIVRN